MKHIIQICDEPYTVVVTGEKEDLKQHPSIVKFPELFEIVDGEIPEDAQYLNFTHDESVSKE